MWRSCVPPQFYRHLLITNYYTYTHIHTKTITDTHTYTHSPPHPRSLASVALNRQPDKRVWTSANLAAGPDGCLPELDYFPCCKVVCLWCIMCFCCWGVFPVLTLYSPRSIVWGLFFFLVTFLMLCCIFLQFPVFLSCLPHCHICMLCMDRLMAYFAGTVTSDNKGLLLHTHTHTHSRTHTLTLMRPHTHTLYTNAPTHTHTHTHSHTHAHTLLH